MVGDVWRVNACVSGGCYQCVCAAPRWSRYRGDCVWNRLVRTHSPMWNRSSNRSVIVSKDSFAFTMDQVAHFPIDFFFPVTCAVLYIDERIHRMFSSDCICHRFPYESSRRTSGRHTAGWYVSAEKGYFPVIVGGVSCENTVQTMKCPSTTAWFDYVGEGFGWETLTSCFWCQ